MNLQKILYLCSSLCQEVSLMLVLTLINIFFKISAIKWDWIIHIIFSFIFSDVNFYLFISKFIFLLVQKFYPR